MERDWPAQRHGAADRADRRSAPRARRRRHLSACRRSRRAPSSTAPAAPDRARPRRDRRRAEEARRRDQDYLDILRSRARIVRIITDELTAVKTSFADAAPHRDRRQRRRHRGRGPDPARGHGRHRQPRAATSSACRSRPIARSAAAARAAPAWRRARRISSPGCSSPRRTAGAVLLLARQVYKQKVWRLPLARAAVRAARRWSTCCRSSRASASPRSCRCPRTRRPGRRST